MDAGRKVHSRLTAPDDAKHWIEHVIHGHAPPSYITERRIYFLADVGERRTRTRIDPRHPAITDRRKQHCDHGKQNGGHGMTVPSTTEDSE